MWLAVDENGAEVAIKFLMKTKEIAYARFRDEVAALERVVDIPGILPVLASDLPDTLGACRPWYAMPVAIPLLSAVVRLTVKRRVGAIAEVAETMAELHARGIDHRDIKPPNLLMYKGRCHIGDFGLVNFPNKADLTGPKEQLGPRWTMAPEVRRDGKSGGSPADVYSLAMTLWIVLGGDRKGFDGQYDAQGDLSISQHCGDLYITPLEELLFDSTARDPRCRPTMQEFAGRLRAWLRVSDQYHEHNPLQWREAQQKLFPVAVPLCASWERFDDIIAVLNIIGKSSNLNHLFFPSGGGLDLEGAVKSHREPDCIELITSGCINIVRPDKLVFYAFDDDPQWNYFRLETSGLHPSGVYQNLRKDLFYEEVTDVAGAVYADRSCWDDGEYGGESLPENSRLVSRYFHGSFVIFQKTSIYNMITETYDARHEKFGAERFRAHIAEMIAYVRTRKA